jgi:hypothetical protein
MKRQLFDIWQDTETTYTPWCAQMVNYVGGFETEEMAKRCVDATRKVREQAAKSGFNQT